jgi:TRAP-type C4-dicarboxylate transport system permease small subunit
MNLAFKYVLAALISSVAVLQFVQIIARYLLALPMPGIEEILVYPTLWLYMLGSANASRQRTQISANVLEIFLKTERSRMILQCVAQFLSLIVVCWLFYWAMDYELYSRKVWKQTAYLYYPIYFAEVSLPVGLGLMVLFTLHTLIVGIRFLFSRSGVEGGESSHG